MKPYEGPTPAYNSLMSRHDAERIWRAGVDAVRPGPLMRRAMADPELIAAIRDARRIVAVGAGKAGGAMTVALEEVLAETTATATIVGHVNVPSGSERPTRWIRLHPARPAGSNHPTEDGVIGSRAILKLAAEAGPDDVGICLLSGGGSALLPAPAEGITLADKQIVTKLLHSCGATINEMNAVRKHLSAVKGGRLAEAFRGKALFSLILSDVIGDPLDVIASGPTAPDPTTFADALAILRRFDPLDTIPAPVRRRLERGSAGEIDDTPKSIPPGRVRNRIIGNNDTALSAARAMAESLGYPVLNLGSFIEGETREAAIAMAGIVRAIRSQGVPMPPPVCVLSGGETTVTLVPNHGRGGRNQEFILAMLAKLGAEGMRNVVLLSGGTDGEDGPTDAAGAIADAGTLTRASPLRPEAFLRRNDAYAFFQAAGDLLVSGPTETNVMDLRVFLAE